MICEFFSVLDSNQSEREGLVVSHLARGVSALGVDDELESIMSEL